MEDVRGELTKLAAKISGREIGSAEFWAGADVVILDSEPEPREPGFYPDPRWVVSPKAAELSWLFCELRDVFIPYYDGQTKIELFGRLANAALRYQERADEVDTRELLLAVLHEAFAIAEEMDEGSFGSLALAFGNEIVDDHIPADERRGFVRIEETKRFFAEKGIEV